jgi:hypothetical protein
MFKVIYSGESLNLRNQSNLSSINTSKKSSGIKEVPHMSNEVPTNNVLTSIKEQKSITIWIKSLIIQGKE